MPEPRCVAEDDDKFCYCADCIPPATPAYFNESSDDEEEISPLYHERLRLQEEFLAEQFGDDRQPMSPMSDGSPEHPYRVFSPYEQRRQRTVTTTYLLKFDQSDPHPTKEFLSSTHDCDRTRIRCARYNVYR